MKNTTDYSDEFSTLKELHEDNIGKKFTDEEFNEIFSLAEKTNEDLAQHADRFQSDMMGLLMTLDEATHKWEEEKLVRNEKGNPREEIKEMIADVGMLIDYFTNEYEAGWGTVSTLANIHESLGVLLHRNYDKHLGYSKTVEEGMKRHSEAIRSLLLEATKEVEKKQLSDLIRWRNFFKERFIEGFENILPKLKTKSAIKKDEKFYHHSMMAGYYEIQEKKLWDTIADFNSSSDSGLRKAAEELEKERKKMSEKAEFHHRKKKELFNAKIHGHWNDTIPTEEEAKKYGDEFLKSNPGEQKETKQTSPKKTPSLREEAIELAKKLEDTELLKYLETAPMKSIQRRIQALREEVELQSTKRKPKVSFRKLSIQEQKKFKKTYKYVSDNSKEIKTGTKVLDKNGLERTIAEASDKTLKLVGDKDWVGISTVKFQD